MSKKNTGKTPLTVANFLNIYTLLLNKDERDIIDVYADVAAQVLNKPSDEVTLAEIMSMQTEIENKYGHILSNLKDRDVKCPRFIKVGGKRFKVVTDITQLTGANIAELDSFTCEPQNIIARLHLILASITRTSKYRLGNKTKKESLELWNERAVSLQGLSIIDAWDIALFFFKVGQSLKAVG